MLEITVAEDIISRLGSVSNNPSSKSNMELESLLHSLEARHQAPHEH